MLYLRDIIDMLEESFIPDLVYKCSATPIGTTDSSRWLYTVTNALTFDYHGTEDEFDRDLFSDSIFELNSIVQDKILKIFEDAWRSMRPELMNIHPLKFELSDINHDWEKYRNDFDYLMILVKNLAYSVFFYIDCGEKDLTCRDEKVWEFDDEVIRPLTNALKLEVYDLLNRADYKRDPEYRLDSHDVKVLYTMFDLYYYSLTTTETSALLLKKSLKYRASLDENGYDCLWEFREVQIYNKNPEGCAIDIMIEKFEPSVMGSILKYVYPNLLNGETVLHAIGRRRPYFFAKLFRHCGTICDMEDAEGRLPMVFILSTNRSLSFVYEIVCENFEYIITSNAN